MAHRYPYDRDRYGHDDRGPFERGSDEVRSWLGDDEAARRRQMDERERAAAPAPDRWATDSRWAGERSYGSDRPYGDRSYGWSEQTRDRQAREMTDRDYGWRSGPAAPAYSGVGHGHYAEPAQHSDSEYDRQAYGGPYGRQRAGAREWSSVEGWRVPGPHAGRGPRSYQRSDERIREEINERLTAHGLIDATEVDCRVVNGEVTLTGFVDSRAAKRAAEDLAEDLYGVREVRNELRVHSHGAGEHAAGRTSEHGVGRTSVLGLTEAQMDTTHSPAAPAADHGRSRTRT